MQIAKFFCFVVLGMGFFIPHAHSAHRSKLIQEVPASKSRAAQLGIDESTLGMIEAITHRNSEHFRQLALPYDRFSYALHPCTRVKIISLAAEAFGFEAIRDVFEQHMNLSFLHAKNNRGESLLVSIASRHGATVDECLSFLNLSSEKFSIPLVEVLSQSLPYGVSQYRNQEGLVSFLIEIAKSVYEKTTKNPIGLFSENRDAVRFVRDILGKDLFPESIQVAVDNRPHSAIGIAQRGLCPLFAALGLQRRPSSCGLELPRPTSASAVRPRSSGGDHRRTPITTVAENDDYAQ